MAEMRAQEKIEQETDEEECTNRCKTEIDRGEKKQIKDSKRDESKRERER